MTACSGLVPLPSRRFALLDAVERQPVAAAELIERFGSPLNLIDPAPLGGNHAELRQAADGAGVSLRVFYARKANKAIALMAHALQLGLGVDVASARELQQAIDTGATGADLIVTAAIKTDQLLRLAIDHGAVVALDHLQEAERWAAMAAGSDAPAAVRLSVELPDRPPSRFGMPAAQARELAAWPALAGRLHGIQFHLDGYAAGNRIAAAREAIELADALRDLGHPIGFVDIGGGIPMRYVDDACAYEEFWRRQRAALLNPELPSLTFRRHGLGLAAAGDQLIGAPAVYPVAQALVRGEWLTEILSADGPDAGRSIGQALSDRGLQLRCEPGRSLLDGCGLTLARVAFTKPGREGTTLVGLEMNRTQLRSAADDFLVDPLLLRAGGGDAVPEPCDGHLVGAYCIERELITWRTLRFSGGVAPGDVIAFPNTAGYMMHILESASHQLPLAANVIVTAADFGSAVRDPIDQVSPLRG